MSTVPELIDAFVARLRANITGVDIFDGPPVQAIGTTGVSIGATREDVSIELQQPSAGLASTAEQYFINCLVWSGSGDTVFKPSRDQVDTIMDQVENTLAVDRSFGGLVSEVWITSATWVQEQTGSGALVMCGFRLAVSKF